MSKTRKAQVFSGLLLLSVFLPIGLAFGEEAPAQAGAQQDLLHSFGLVLAYLVEAFIIFWLAKIAYGKIYRRVPINRELFVNDNQALAVSTVGYYFGILLAIGGVLAGPASNDPGADLVAVGQYGLVAIALMMIASFICDKALLPKFNNTKEIVEDKNLGVGFVEAGMFIANGLIIMQNGAGTGSWQSGLAFWALAQVVLIIAGRIYDAMTPHKIHEEIEKDNAAVGLAFGGALIGIGNVVSLAIRGDFTSWSDSFTTFGTDTVFGFLMLFIIHKVTDVVLAPRVSLAAEQTQEKPNIGAGLLEAFGYIGASMLLVWAL